MKILVFTEGTILMHSSGAHVSRETRVEQVKDKEKSVHNYSTYVPIGNAIQKLNTWSTKGAKIYYITSRKTPEEVQQIQSVLHRNGFPEGELLCRQSGEEYKDVAERLIPDVLIEDDCESIGGIPEMTYTNIKPEMKSKIIHYPVKEFGGIDHLPNEL